MLLTSYAELAKTVRKYKKQNPDSIVGCVGGVFDLFHIGHATVLAECRRKCDFLIVLVMPDSVVKKAKGDGRPVVVELDRAKIVSKNSDCTAVIIGSRKTDADFMKNVQIDKVFLAHEHIHKKPEYAKIFPGAKIAMLNKRENESEISTSAIIKKILLSQSPKLPERRLSWTEENNRAGAKGISLA